MVTDGWDGVRNRIARLFGRGQPDASIERRLQESWALLAAAGPGELAPVQAQLASQWETRLADLLADHPDAAGELEDLVQQIQVSTATASDHSFAARDVQMNADRGGVNAGAIHGSVSTGPTKPGPASS